jgi:putative acetyltransferase
MTRIRTASPHDQEVIRDVHRQAFGREDEGRLVVLLREGGYHRLSLVAEVDGKVAGHILFSELAIIGSRGTVPALALAPLAVVPEQQRRGVGSMLVREGLRLCRSFVHRIVIVLGHPDYYPRFGFSRTLAEPLRSIYSGPSFMALELEAGALEGVSGEVRYPPPFQAF